MSEIKMLPLPPLYIVPSVEPVDYPDVAQALMDYARANVARATEPMKAEIEALRAEVERLTFEMERLQQQYDERTAFMIVHRGSALACSAAVRAAYSEEHHRAERLAEALRMMVENADDLVAYRHDEDDIGDRPCCQVASYEPHADHCPTHIARAALRDHDQEVGNG